jgi:hypothetical protein
LVLYIYNNIYIDFRLGRFVACVLSHTALGVLTHPTSEVQ